MILVDVYIPSVDQTYDFMLDENTDVTKVILEILEMVAKKVQNGVPTQAEEFSLYHMSKKSVLKRGRTLAASGVRDGSKLLLV